MDEKYVDINSALVEYLTAFDKLQKLGVTPNKKDFTSQIGEWFVNELYGGQRAVSSTQKHWDIQVENRNVQIKTHSKAPTNKNRWTPINYSADAKIDELIIVVFTSDYKLREFYRIPWTIAQQVKRQNKNRIVIRWDHIKDYEISADKLPNQALVKLFLK